jgi:ubiquitin-like 1-activating enzyme E1 A
MESNGLAVSEGAAPAQLAADMPLQPSNGISNGEFLWQSICVVMSSANEMVDEIALYDRQIRLWGMKAQEKIRNANILLITMKGLGNEIAKNLVLAGIGAITIVDHEVVAEVDLGTQFLITEEHVGVNRALAASDALRRLNPRVQVTVDVDDIRLKGPSFFQPFSVVIATDVDSSTLNVINTATRLNNRPFYAAGSQGMYGFIFADLIEHDYVLERQKSNRDTRIGPETRTRSVVAVASKKEDNNAEQVTKRELYSTWLLASDVAPLPTEITSRSIRRRAVTPALGCFRALWEFTQLHGRNPSQNNHDDLAQFTLLAGQKHAALGLPSETMKSDFLRSFLQNIGSEVAPVTALLGGQLAQDVINVLGQNKQPIQNMVVFDGEAMEASQYALHCDGEIGSKLLDAAPQAMQMGNGNGIPAMVALDPSQVITLD